MTVVPGTGGGRAHPSPVDSLAAGTAIEAENDIAAPKEIETEATDTEMGARTTTVTARSGTKARCLPKKLPSL